MKKYLFALAAMFSATSLLMVPAGAASFITNGSFESGALPLPIDQGVLPAPWVTVPVGADTYSSDPNTGLPPSIGGNFTGVTAYDGIRWVAGWSACNDPACPERFGQLLVSPLVAGSTYNITSAASSVARGPRSSRRLQCVCSHGFVGRLASVPSPDPRDDQRHRMGAFFL
jgi:hypothetical protein